jgi:hypothetical protein
MAGTNEDALRPWSELTADEQTALRVAFGHWLERLPPTCSLQTKIERFRRWLRAQGVDYRPEGMPSRR